MIKMAASLRDIHLVSRRANGMYLGLQDREKAYIVGFPHRRDAIMVSHRLPVKSPVSVLIRRKYIESIADDVNNGLKEFDVPPEWRVDNDLTIDIEAELYIGQNKRPRSPAADKRYYDIETVTMEEFFSLPFSKAIGIVLANTIISRSIAPHDTRNDSHDDVHKEFEVAVSENHHYVIFQCHVVDPSPIDKMMSL